MARGIDEVELVGLAVLGGIVHGDSAGLDGDAALALNVQVVQNLVLSIPPKFQLSIRSNFDGHSI